MIIISHRGYWKTPEEKNLEVAFRRSFDLGFGTETDIRDCAGEILMSHDMPSGKEMTLDEFFKLPGSCDLPMALNIKADGLAKKLGETLKRNNVKDAFVFDMSVPDLIQFLKTDIPAFTRMSEYERDPSCYDKAAGVWLDGFTSIWYDFATVKKLLDDGKRVCLVSPELHGRPENQLWEMLKKNNVGKHDKLLLCTDIPEKAQAYFA